MNEAEKLLFQDILERLKALDEKLDRYVKTERIEKTGKKLFGFIPSVALPWTVAGLSFGAMMGSSLLQKLIEKLVS